MVQETPPDWSDTSRFSQHLRGVPLLDTVLDTHHNLFMMFYQPIIKHKELIAHSHLSLLTKGFIKLSECILSSRPSSNNLLYMQVHTATIDPVNVQFSIDPSQVTKFIPTDVAAAIATS
jgi:hypothetical protein